MFEFVEHTFTMLCSKVPLAHTQSLEHHYLVNFGATQIDNQNTGENWVRDSECSCVQEPMNVAYDNQGMFNNYAAILSKWDDTTNFDNVRGPAWPQDGLSVAGGRESMSEGGSFHAATTSSGSPHPLEAAEAQAEKAGNLPAVAVVARGQSNLARRSIGVTMSKPILYSVPGRYGLHSK